MKWILLVLIGLFIIRYIQAEIRDASRKKQHEKQYEDAVGRPQKKKSGIRDLKYVAQCFEKGQKEKGIAALEAIAAQQGNLEVGWERLEAAGDLFELALLGSCEVTYYNNQQKRSEFTIEMPEYQSREKAGEIAGWLLEIRRIETKKLAFQYNQKNKDKQTPEDYHNHVYFLLALLAKEEERYALMKQAAQFKSNEARWWLLRNGMFEKAFPDPEEQKKQYYSLYYANEWKKLIWGGDIDAALPLQEWMIREGGFPEELSKLYRSKEIQENTAKMMREDVTAALKKLKKQGSSVGTETLLRIEEQDRKDKEELIELIVENKMIHEAAAEFTRDLEELKALQAEEEAEAAGKRSDSNRKRSGSEFDLASMPGIVYDSSNRMWKRRGIYGDHAVYYNNDGGEVTIYSAQVSANFANTSAGGFHW